MTMRCGKEMNRRFGSAVGWCGCFLVFLLSLQNSLVLAEGTTVLTGKVLDVDNRPVAGAQVFMYDGPDSKRSANFISAPTDQNGLYRMVLSPGRYWAVARLKKTDGYGPLMPGDKHSGEPGEIEVASGQEVVRDFIVADLKDARKARTKDREGLIRISGRIVDEKGAPIVKAYAIALSRATLSGIPDYLSAWVDQEGHYTLYLPRGKYFIGGALSFPPGQNYFMQGEVLVDADRSDVDIVRKSRTGK